MWIALGSDTVYDGLACKWILISNEFCEITKLSISSEKGFTRSFSFPFSPPLPLSPPLYLCLFGSLFCFFPFWSSFLIVSVSRLLKTKVPSNQLSQRNYSFFQTSPLLGTTIYMIDSTFVTLLYALTLHRITLILL